MGTCQVQRHGGEKVVCDGSGTKSKVEATEVQAGETGVGRLHPWACLARQTFLRIAVSVLL